LIFFGGLSYGILRKHYEIRSEDSAVDIQVYEEKGEKII
jgi:hypothetical protein